MVTGTQQEGGCRGREGGELASSKHRGSVRVDGDVLGIDGGDGSTAVQVCLMLLTQILKW